MKKSNFWKLLSGTAFFAAVALASCVDDNDDKGMPYLEVTPDVLTFNADGAPEGASAFTVKSNRPWTLEVLEGSDWVTPSATQGSGDGTVEFTIPASNVGRIAKLSFNLKNAYGAYWTKEVTIEQGEAPKAGEVSALVAYIKNTWPSLESGTEELNYSQKTIPAVILANNEGGNNFGKLYVGDNITLPNSAIILYSTTDRYYPSNSTIDGQPATGFKLGTSSLAGVFTSEALGASLTGDKKLSFYAVAWTGKAATVYIRVNNGGAVSGDGSHAITASAGATGSGNDFTFTDVTDSDYYTFQLTGLTAASTVTISTSPDFTAASDRNTGRAIVLGVQVY